MRQEIEAALEKENIERERRGGEKEGEGEEDETQVGTSASLKADLDEVQKKVERFQNRRGLEDVPGVKDAKDAVVECYRWVCDLTDVWRRAKVCLDGIQRQVWTAGKKLRCLRVRLLRLSRWASSSCHFSIA